MNGIYTLINGINGAWGWGARKLNSALGQTLEWLSAMLWSVVEWFWTMIGRLIYLLPNPFDSEWLLELDWQSLITHAAGLMSVIELVTWVFPVGGVAIFYLATYALCGTIRLVRWCLAVIPGIGA